MREEAKLFGLSAEKEALLEEITYRSTLPPGQPTDPLVHRFYGRVQVHGTTWKEIIQEAFGDGIMARSTAT